MINEYTIILATILIFDSSFYADFISCREGNTESKMSNVVRIPTERFKKIYLYFSVNSRISDSREESNERYFLVGSRLCKIPKQ